MKNFIATFCIFLAIASIPHLAFCGILSLILALNSCTDKEFTLIFKK